jgi:hypothetical protein
MPEILPRNRAERRHRELGDSAGPRAFSVAEDES